MPADEVLDIIAACLVTDAYEFNDHFVKRLDERKLFFTDVLALLEEPIEVRVDGVDEYGRKRVIVRGDTPVGEAELVVCIEDEPFCEFITIYWT
ncbi:MAG: DUF4258 domain-containing protein [Planctomycetota bacterium]